MRPQSHIQYKSISNEAQSSSFNIKKMFETTNWNASSAIVRKSILLFYLRYVRSCFSFYFGQIVQWAGVVQPGRCWFLFFSSLSNQPIVVCHPTTIAILEFWCVFASIRRCLFALIPLFTRSAHCHHDRVSAHHFHQR